MSFNYFKLGRFMIIFANLKGHRTSLQAERVHTDLTITGGALDRLTFQWGRAILSIDSIIIT